MKEIMKELAESMARKIRLVNRHANLYENKREFPIFSELKGMEHALRTMGIDFEYEYDDDIKISAVTVMGERVEI